MNNTLTAAEEQSLCTQNNNNEIHRTVTDIQTEQSPTDQHLHQ